MIDIAGVFIVEHGAPRRKHNKASCFTEWYRAKFSFQSEYWTGTNSDYNTLSIRIIDTPCIVITKVSFFFSFQVNGPF